MNKVRNLIATLILITIIVEPIAIGNAQSSQPIISAQSVTSQKVSWTDLQHTFFPYQVSGNIFYLLNITASFEFPQDTTFTGVLNMGCGIDVNLVNTTAWKVIETEPFCPAYQVNGTESAGTYNSILHVYLNSMNNYTNTNYPKNIIFYIYSAFNKPEYKSANYSINLAKGFTNFNKIVIDKIFQMSTIELMIGILGAFLFISGIITVFQYRKFRKEKTSNTKTKSFKSYLQKKIRKKAE